MLLNQCYNNLFTYMIIFLIGLLHDLFKKTCLAISRMRNISTLNLANNSLNSKSLLDLSQAISSLAKLKYLDLSFNGLGDNSATHLKDIMQKCQSLTHLSLKSCCLTTDFVSNHDVSFFRKLIELDLSYNRLGVLGLTELISVLKTSSDLKRVKLNGCVKNSLVTDTKNIVELFLSLQDMTQNHLEVIEFKQNKIDLKNLPFELSNILVI